MTNDQQHSIGSHPPASNYLNSYDNNKLDFSPATTIPFDFMQLAVNVSNQQAFIDSSSMVQSTLADSQELLQESLSQQSQQLNSTSFSNSMSNDDSTSSYGPPPSPQSTNFLIPNASPITPNLMNSNTTQSNHSFASSSQQKHLSACFDMYEPQSFSIQDQQYNAFRPSHHRNHPYLIATSNKANRKKSSASSATTTSPNIHSNTKDFLVNEWKRQVHIQSEQKRRAQIKDGFEDLRNELPSCLNKKMSKVALLHRTVQHIQHLKNTQNAILFELERLVKENDQLRRFQYNIIQSRQQQQLQQFSLPLQQHRQFVKTESYQRSQ